MSTQILVATEDTSKQSFQVAYNILKKTIEIAYGIKFPANHFSSVPEDSDLYMLTKSTYWKSRKDLIRISQLIASELVVEPLVFHIDADVKFSNFLTGQNYKYFQDTLIPRIQDILVSKGYSKQKVDDLILMMPSYSIESWLFYSTQKLIDICEQKNYSQNHLSLATSWHNENELIEEVNKIKDSFPFKDTLNESLSKTFPVKSALDSQKSYSLFYKKIEESSSIRSLYQSYIDSFLN